MTPTPTTLHTAYRDWLAVKRGALDRIVSELEAEALDWSAVGAERGAITLQTIATVLHETRRTLRMTADQVDRMREGTR